MKKKLSNSIESLFTVFEDELEANIQEAAGLVRRGYFKDSITTRFINKKLPEEIY